MHHHIDGGAVATDLFRATQADHVKTTAANHFKLYSAGRYQHQTSTYAIALLSFFHLHGAELVKAIGKHFGKTARHVLNNNRSRGGRWKTLEYPANGLSSSG